MKRLNIFLFLIIAISSSIFALPPDEHKTLAIGAAAPDFKLPGVDGKTYSLASFKNAAAQMIDK